MKRIIIGATILGFSSAYGAQSTTSTTITTATTTTTTMTAPTAAFIYQQLILNGIPPAEAQTQAEAWHPPMTIPFTNPSGDEAPDNAE